MPLLNSSRVLGPIEFNTGFVLITSLREEVKRSQSVSLVLNLGKATGLSIVLWGLDPTKVNKTPK